MSLEVVRVLHVIGSSDIGGAERNLVTLLESLPPDRVESHVACQGLGPMIDDYRRASASLHSFSFEPSAPLALAHLVADLRPHVVHTHLWTADLAAGMTLTQQGTPVKVSTVEGSYFRMADVIGVARWRRTAASLVYRAVYMLFDHVVAVSEVTAEDLSRRPGLKVPRRRITVIPPGIDGDAVRTSGRPGAPDVVSALRRPLVVCVANLFPIKAHDLLLRAMALVTKAHPTAHLLLVGDGPLRPQIHKCIVSLGLEASVTLLGERRDALGLMEAADVVVLASNSEGTPRVLLEAMCLGKPVVATAVGGVPELLGDGAAGRLVPPRDPAALAAALCGVLAKPQSTRATRRLGQERVERHYSARGAAERIEALYRGLRGAPGRRGVDR